MGSGGNRGPGEFHAVGCSPRVLPVQAGTGVSDQFAAMPSIHVAWAAVVVFGVISASTSHWRWVIAAHLPITILVVAAAGTIGGWMGSSQLRCSWPA